MHMGEMVIERDFFCEQFYFEHLFIFNVSALR